MKTKIFLICPIRFSPDEVQVKIEKYVKKKEDEGYIVHWPKRDTDQEDPRGTRICTDNLTAIYDADEIHIWYDKTSAGSHFDIGGLAMLKLVFGLDRKVVLVNPDAPDGQAKSFLKVIRDMEKMQNPAQGVSMNKLDRIVFGRGLLIPTLSGKKQITLRNYRPEAHDFLKGEILRGEFMEGITVLLEITADTEVTTFAELSDEAAREDGFESAEDAFQGLKEYYPDLKKTDLCAIIRYRVYVLPNGHKVADINEFTF